MRKLLTRWHVRAYHGVMTTWEDKFSELATDDAVKWEAIEDADEIVGMNDYSERYWEVACRSYKALAEG